MTGNKDFVAVLMTVVGVLIFVGFFLIFGDESRHGSDSSSTTVPSSPVDKGRRLARDCTPCHDMTSSHRLTQAGPPLWGIVGRRAASMPGYKYSQAHMKAGQGGLVWDESSLDRYLDNPKEFIPGNKMAFAGLHGAEERKAVIEYLKTLQDNNEGRISPLIGQAILSLSAAEDGFSSEERIKRGRIEAEKCGACHDLGPTRKNIVGPWLLGVVGRPVGTVVGYDFSPAFKEAVKLGLKTWTTKNLDQFLAHPNAIIPGTRMVFAGIEDEQRRRDLIIYLRTLK
ncbi:MAG: c-type cytochrome [Magnetococcales bacterium]|nr:c-type cytochrome [Magnetococcales bacterium]